MNGVDLDLCIQSEQEQIQKTRCSEEQMRSQRLKLPFKSV
jgi:hypothetical protein